MSSKPIYFMNADSPSVIVDGKAVEEAVRFAGVRLGKNEPGLFTLKAPTDFLQDWRVWSTEEWPRFEQCLHRVYQAALDFQFERVLEVDAEMTTILSDAEEVRKRSRSMARVIVESTTGAKGRSLLDRFQAASASGACEGHGVTAFGLHMVLFHVPLLPATIAYLFAEWRSAGEAIGDKNFKPTIETFFWRYPDLIQQVQHRISQQPQPLRVVQHG